MPNLNDAFEYAENIRGDEPQGPIALAMEHPHLMSDADFERELAEDRNAYRANKRRLTIARNKAKRNKAA